jgi:hypothetical protein
MPEELLRIVFLPERFWKPLGVDA